MLYDIQITINGALHELSVSPQVFLLELLRDRMGLLGTKKGCDGGECGACTVLMDGAPVYACLTLAVQANGRRVTTVEGLGTPSHLHFLQEAFIEAGAIQCGYCTPGILMASRALLAAKPKPTEDEIARALAGNLCRCTGWRKIIDAVLLASEDKGPDMP
jgi:carbon-monoxide dehydrogenase small subunit